MSEKMDYEPIIIPTGVKSMFVIKNVSMPCKACGKSRDMSDMLVKTIRTNPITFQNYQFCKDSTTCRTYAENWNGW